MLAETVREWTKDWVAQGIEEGIEKGIEKGIEQGIADSDAEWEQWLARKQDAEAAGRRFDEPPPSKRR